MPHVAPKCKSLFFSVIHLISATDTIKINLDECYKIKRRTMRKAFTLIELLVVIAIIALLLAIVTPSLNTAKKSAAGSVCLANLHGLSRAFNTYAQENDSKVARCNQGSNRWVDRPHQLDTLTGERTYTNRQYSAGKGKRHNGWCDVSLHRDH